MTKDFSVEKRAELNALRKLSADPKQKSFELGYLISKLSVSEQHIAKNNETKATSKIFVENATRDITLLTPYMFDKLNKTPESKDGFYRDSVEDIIAQRFDDKLVLERRRLDLTAKRVEKLHEICSQKWNELFNVVGEDKSQVLDMANPFDVAPTD